MSIVVLAATDSSYGPPTSPSRFSITSFNISSSAAPPRASRRAGAACSGGVTTTTAAPALSAAPEANTKGSSRRAWCHTGTAVLAISAAVYVDSGRPNRAAAGRETRAVRGSSPVHAFTAAAAVVAPLALSTHEPTLIGEVTLNIRSMLRKRAGLPRSEMRRTGLTLTPASATPQLRRASVSLPRTPARKANPAAAPPIPPVKK